MNIVEALKAFFYALNGQTPTGDNVSDVIRAGTANVSLNNESALATRVDTVEDDVEILQTDVAALQAVNSVEYEEGEKSFVLNSSTADSTKQFRITVDDTGTLTATEIVVTPPADPETPGA